MILVEVKLSSLVPGGLEVPDIKQQRRGIMDLTLNNISDQFFARFLFFLKAKLSYLLNNSNCKYQLCSEKNLFYKLFSSKNSFSNSDSFFKVYISYLSIYFFTFIFELFFTISLPEELHLFLAVSLSQCLS